MVFTKNSMNLGIKETYLIFETEILVQNDSFLEHGLPVFQ